MKKMRRLGTGGLVVFALIMLISCNSFEKRSVSENVQAADLVKQQADGTISLKLEDAEYYYDKDNPASNTAEWRFFAGKSGRYEIWLSSATKDTLDLRYINSVTLSIRDERLDLKHSGEKVILNNNDTRFPYRADTYTGSYYIQEPGEYNIQLISEKAVLTDAGNSASQEIGNTKLMSVILVPITR